MMLCRIPWVGRGPQKFPIDASSEGWLPWITSLDLIPEFDHCLVTLYKVMSAELQIRLTWLCRFRGKNNLSVVSTFVIYRDSYVKTKSKLWISRFQGKIVTGWVLKKLNSKICEISVVYVKLLCLFFPLCPVTALPSLNGSSVKDSSVFILASTYQFTKFTQLYLNVSFLSGFYMSISESWETPPNNCSECLCICLDLDVGINLKKQFNFSRRVFHLVDRLHIWYDVLQEKALSSSCPSLTSLSTVTFQQWFYMNRNLWACVDFIFNVIFALLMHEVLP